jgi:hypothetical protein
MLQKLISPVQNMGWLLGPGIGALVVISPMFPSEQQYIKSAFNSIACHFVSEIFICSSCNNLFLDSDSSYILQSVISIHPVEYNYPRKVDQIATPCIRVRESNGGNFVSYNYFLFVRPIRKAKQTQSSVAICKEKSYS